ncbi:MAG: chemotaxis protein CheB [Gammaproteobacteria bacterium]
MDDSEQQNASNPHYIVGLGASAGGLEALEAFFSNMSIDSGMSFVIIQHLAPDFKSLMDDLLARHTKMAIHKAVNNMEVEPDSIYLIPPKKEMVMEKGRLLLRDRNTTGALNLPIDIFFRSLAEDAGDRAIGIILSGTGSDGSRGIAAIHENSGLVICQNPDSASFDGMPNSAILTNLVDVTANPIDMPEILLEYAQTSTKTNFSTEGRLPKDNEIFSPIFVLLNSSFSVDFQFYKPATITRRIERRMTINHMQTVDQYTDFLNTNEEEIEHLYRDLLIGVTEFFRDEQVWQYVASAVIPQICSKCTKDHEVRFWVPGCASGEEAYTIAILAIEWLTANNKPLNLRIFATDLHKGSLAQAGNGVYPQASLANMSTDRLSRFFLRLDDNAYQVSKELRRVVVFANQNVIKDPPFTKLDFISCRNMLIYFQTPAQQRVFSLFHFALKVGAYLLLGPSESLGDIEDEFEEQHRRYKVFTKRRDLRLQTGLQSMPRTMPLTASGNVLLRDGSGYTSSTGGIAGRDINLIRAYDALLDSYVPASVLIEYGGLLAHTFGSAADYLRTPKGVSSLNITELVHPDLRTALSTGLQRIAKENTTISYGGIKVNLGEDDKRVIRVSVKPLSDYKSSNYLLVIFEETHRVEEKADINEAPVLNGEVVSIEPASVITNDHMRYLEEELRHTQENLQATVEELETSNEELQATNEELMASNEELQSTNEELHSVNEELYTVNREYEEKILELTQLTEDMDNLLSSTEIGTIFLDNTLKVRKFTPAAARQFSLLAQDIGRPINHLNRKIVFKDFQEELEKVIKFEERASFEVKNDDQQWFLMELNPYRNEQNETTGVVITFIDVTLIKEASQIIEQRNEDLQTFAYSISHDLNEPIRMITSFSKLLTENYDSGDRDKVTEYVDMVNDNAQRLNSMLSGTLEFSRVITQGSAFVETDLADVLSAAKSELIQKIEETDTLIECEHLPVAHVDPQQMKRVFKEIIDNAIIFCRPKETPQIVITATQKDRNYYISFSDNGIGIPVEFKNKLFSMFTCANTRSDYEGLGIGLAVTRRIVERHNGEITCASNSSGGSVFTLILPVEQPEV